MSKNKKTPEAPKPKRVLFRNTVDDGSDNEGLYLFDTEEEAVVASVYDASFNVFKFLQEGSGTHMIDPESIDHEELGRLSNNLTKAINGGFVQKFIEE